MLGLVIFISTCGASLSSGALVGFIFGHPRSMERARKSETNTLSAPSSTKIETGTGSFPESTRDNAASNYDGWANNNLVEVSDWITKIIIGLTLIQFTKITQWLQENGPTVGTAAGFSDPSQSKVFGISIIITFFILGFILSYVYTRTKFSDIIAKSIVSINNTLTNRLHKAEKKVEHLSEQVKSSDRAFAEIVRKLGGDEQSSQALKALYLPPPDSFRLAINVLDDLVQDEARDDLDYLWALKAAAYGQKFQYLRLTSADKSSQEEAADSAFFSAQKAVTISPEQKNYLRSLWNPTDPHYSDDEGDLRALWDDVNQRQRFSGIIDS